MSAVLSYKQIRPAVVGIVGGTAVYMKGVHVTQDSSSCRPVILCPYHVLPQMQTSHARCQVVT